MWKSSWIISSRFTKLKQNEKLYTWMYMISIATISLSVLALISVTTITQSIHNIISSKLGSKYPYIEVYEFNDSAKIKNITGSNASLKNIVLLTKRGEDLPISVFAMKVKPKNNINIVNENLSKLNGETIILSKSIAEKLNLQIGDKILLSSSSINNIHNLTQYLFTIIDLMDNSYQLQAIIPFDQVAKEDNKNWRQVTVLDPKNLLNIYPVIEDLLINDVNRNKIVTWFDKIPSLYDAMKLEKIAIYTIFCILLMISSFTIFATIASLGIKRKRDVAILRMIGCRRKQIFLIFILQGVKIFIASSIIGVFLSYLIIENIGIIFSFVSFLTGIDITNLLEIKESYLHISIELSFILKILIINFIISIMSSIIPSYIIAKMETGDVVKYG
jgi:ABC-type lipoprotein release transport system permease subunit